MEEVFGFVEQRNFSLEQMFSVTGVDKKLVLLRTSYNTKWRRNYIHYGILTPLKKFEGRVSPQEIEVGDHTQ